MTHFPWIFPTCYRLLTLCGWVVGSGLSLLLAIPPALALPPVEDTPEEILRAETSFAARSPLDNQALTPSEYAVVIAELEQHRAAEPTLNPKLKRLIYLLKLRKFYRSILPFL
jgi:hypothetical protein